MKKSKSFHAGIVMFAALLGLTRLPADVIETQNGSRIVGKIVKIDSGDVVVSTDYAGELKIKQKEVKTIVTDDPVSVRLESGTRVEGRITSPADGSLQIASPEGPITTPLNKVAASWKAGAKDPQIVALERHWAYEASVDIAGKTGNQEQLGTSAALRATLKTPEDTLQFYTSYDRQVTDQLKSADQLKAGVDYQDNFSGKLSWYARDEGGFDRVKDIDIYNVSAAGLGYDVIKQPKHLLTLRGGLSFRYEGYKNPATTDVKSAGLDFGLNHEFQIGDSKLINRIAYVPSFDDFSNFRLTHESSYEIPLANPAWKLRVGVNNDYNSKPGTALERLDTSYFTRLVLNWK